MNNKAIIESLLSGATRSRSARSGTPYLRENGNLFNARKFGYGVSVRPLTLSLGLGVNKLSRVGKEYRFLNSLFRFQELHSKCNFVIHSTLLRHTLSAQFDN